MLIEPKCHRYKCKWVLPGTGVISGIGFWKSFQTAPILKDTCDEWKTVAEENLGNLAQHG
jgi:hypothetical protein